MPKAITGKRNIVVVGASAGGISVLMDLIGQLPENFPAAIFIVQHLSPFSPSILPQILNRAGALEVSHPVDGEEFSLGKIYVAPPNHHMLLDGNHIVVRKGPKENRFRPSIDALFRSAAYNYGPRVISIVLSGMLDDGTSGMWTVKRLGGLAIIQDPEEATCPSMPSNVLEFVEVDLVLPVKEMGRKLQTLVKESVNVDFNLPDEEIQRLQAEIEIAAQDDSFQKGMVQLGEPSSLTCPECAGSLSTIRDGQITRYRCHTGHAFRHQTLLATATRMIEDNLWKAVKSFEEVVMLLEESARQSAIKGDHDLADEYRKKADMNKKVATDLRQMIFRLETEAGVKSLAELEAEAMSAVKKTG